VYALGYLADEGEKKNIVQEIIDGKTSPAIEERNFYEGTTNLLRILNSRQSIHTAVLSIAISLMT
jgi:hypothetical protein